MCIKQPVEQSKCTCIQYIIFKYAPSYSGITYTYCFMVESHLTTIDTRGRGCFHSDNVLPEECMNKSRQKSQVSRVDKQRNEPGRWKSRIVAIFLLFLILLHVLT